MALTKQQITDYIGFQMNRKKHSVLREELFKQNPHCHWCGRKVALRTDLYTRNLKKGETYPDNTATVDHLYDRLNPEQRYRIYKNDEDKVLACFKCDIGRGGRSHLQVPAAQLIKRQEILTKRKKEKILKPRPLLLYEELFKGV